VLINLDVRHVEASQKLPEHWVRTIRDDDVLDWHGLGGHRRQAPVDEDVVPLPSGCDDRDVHAAVPNTMLVTRRAVATAVQIFPDRTWMMFPSRSIRVGRSSVASTSGSTALTENIDRW